MVEPLSGLPSPALSNAGIMGNGITNNLSSLHITQSPTKSQNKIDESAESRQKGIGDFLNELKLARENAILGNYEESLKKYKSTVQIVQNHLLILNDVAAGTRQKWRLVLESIQREVNMTSDTLNLKKQFSGGFGTGTGSSLQGMKKPTITERLPVSIMTPDNNSVVQPIVPIPNNMGQKRQPIFERFGNQAPFQHHNGAPDSYFGNDLSGDDPFGNSNAYCYVQKRNKSQFPLPRQSNFGPPVNSGNPFDSGNDPDVWDPPTPPIQKQQPLPQRTSMQPQGAWGAPRRPPPYQAQQNGQPPQVQPQPQPFRKPPKQQMGGGAVAGVKPPGQPPSGNKNQQNRQYDKPWLSGVEKGGNGQNQEKKNTFLYHVYPDGVGPDSELIQMLERDVVDRNPQVNFSDIAELDDAKKTLQEAVLLPLYMPNYFKGIRRPWKGVLLFGPPGTGKTMLAKAVATQGKTTFFNITASSISSKWKGESEKLVRILFEMARFYAPTTIFMDEIDAIAGARSSGEHESNRRVKAELLIQMDGVSVASSASANENQAEGERQKNVIVLAATNIPWDLDEAFRRRLEKRIHIPLPSEKGRQQLFDINLKGIKVDESVDFEELVRKTKGYSGADIANVCREAAMMPMRRKILEGGLNFDEISKINHEELEVPITMSDFNEALKNIQKSVSQHNLDEYAKWMAEFGCV